MIGFHSVSVLSSSAIRKFNNNKKCIETNKNNNKHEAVRAIQQRIIRSKEVKNDKYIDEKFIEQKKKKDTETSNNLVFPKTIANPNPDEDT